MIPVRKSLWILLLIVCACDPVDQTIQPVTAIPAAFDQIPAVGEVEASPGDFDEAGSLKLPGGDVIRLTWAQAPDEGVSEVAFYLLPLSPSARLSGMRGLIGTDTNPSNGASIRWRASSEVFGYLAAEAISNGAVIARTEHDIPVYAKPSPGSRSSWLFLAALAGIGAAVVALLRLHARRI